jgi:hypothetical protein
VGTPPSALAADRPASKSKTDRDALILAAKIDELLAARWAAAGVKPAPLVDDASFLRRLSLDLTGEIPPIDEVTDFLDYNVPDKRQSKIDQLLSERPKEDSSAQAYPYHFANVWRAILLRPPEDPGRQLATEFEKWLAERLKGNTGFDRIVREMLASPNPGPPNQPPVNPQGASAFFQANEGKPENLAGSAARLFLGLKLECAQCHNHPHASWTRHQFWEFAAFFANNPGRKSGDHSIRIPGTKETVQARFPDGSRPEWEIVLDNRSAAAQWITSAANPYFARTVVNRMWAYFFGLGLIEPVEEGSPENPPSHPELLDELARQFAAHGFDLKFLIKAITLSQAYQRSSVTSHPSQTDPRLFAHMAVRSLSPEQLFDSLAVATWYKQPRPQERNAFVQTATGPTPRAEFLVRFAQQDRRVDAQTTILQALHLMNGRFMVEVTNLEFENMALATAANAEKRLNGNEPITTAYRIEELFKSALSRKPTAKELASLVKYVDSGGPARNPKKALADVFWALLNSSEFMFNH